MRKAVVIQFLVVLVTLMLVSPVLRTSAGNGTVTKSRIINVAEDAYVVAYLNDVNDVQDLRERNYGSLDFVKTWYLWNVGEEGGREVESEKIISAIYLKFDLGAVQDKKIESAMLQLYARDVSLVSPRIVQVFPVSSDWSESTINFASRPAWGTTAIASTIVYRSNHWYAWDVTDHIIREKRSGQISFVVVLRDMEPGMEELVAFNSREAQAKVPRLVVTYTESEIAIPWSWWLIGGIIIAAVATAAFFAGLKLRAERLWKW